MGKKRLAIISEYPPMEGITASNMEGLTNTLSDDYDITVYTFKGVPSGVVNGVKVKSFLEDKRPYKAYMHKKQLNFTYWPHWFGATARILFGCVFRGADIVHLQHDHEIYQILLKALPMLKIFGKKVIVTENTPVKRLNKKQLRYLKKYDKIIAHTTYEQERLRKAGIPYDKIEHIPYGVRNYPFLPKGNGKTFLLHGELMPYHGYEYAIEAFSKVVRKAGNAKLLIAGEPSPNKKSIGYYKKLKSLIKKHKLERNVTFVKHASESRIHKVYTKVDVVLLPYLEYKSNDIIDLLANQRAIIASPLPEFKEHVKDGLNGYIVNPKDTRKLAEKMISIIKDPRKLKKMEQHNIEITDRRAWWNLREKYIRAYSE